MTQIERLGRIDSTEIYFSAVQACGRAPIGLGAIGATLALLNAERRISPTTKSCLYELVQSGATHIICTGREADRYEDTLDEIIVRSNIESLQRSVISTYSIGGFEEALNLAVCLDENAILVVAHSLQDVVDGLLDFGMQK